MLGILLTLVAASLATHAGAHPSGAASATARTETVRDVVSRQVRPLMRRYGIPGMAVGITVGGRHFVFDYGSVSKATRKPVGTATLFEIGSITKTFTATFVSYARVTGKLSLSDEASADFPALRGTSFDHVRLVNLGTHTAGGLPLQFPDDVRSDADAIGYYRRWRPAHPAGTYRLYSNPGIMLLGLIAATRSHASFVASMQHAVFAPLGLHDTFLAVPAGQSSRYAQGYTAAGEPKRLSPGPLAAEAYGIRTTAADMLRFVDANMNFVPLDAALGRAIVDTHIGYYRIGEMTQDLIWEQYRVPVSSPALLQGNSDRVVFEENRALRIDPPQPPRDDVLLDKTGSTNGFAAYVAFVPASKLGIVLLANEAYPTEARVTAAYRILTHLREEAAAIASREPIPRHGRAQNARRKPPHGTVRTTSSTPESANPRRLENTSFPSRSKT